MSRHLHAAPWRTPIAALLVVGALACGDVQGPGTGSPGVPPGSSDDGGTPAAGLPSLLVSNPLASSATKAGAFSLDESPAGDVVYASMSPGSVADGERIVIETRRTGTVTEVELVNGGFDPVAIAAVEGDTLDVRLYLAGERVPVEHVSVVPERRSPVLVRVDPPPGRQDVPLNAVLLLVFSEPIDGATLTSSSVRLSRDGVPVPGTLAFGDPAQLTVTFTPAALLPDGRYTLLVTQDVADLGGENLEAPVTSDFDTPSGSTSSSVTDVYERETPHEQPGYHSRYVFYADGRFELEYETTTWGDFSYFGTRSGTATQITFRFDDRNLAGPWEATGTVAGDRLTVEYNVVMQLADFENGTYTRSPGGGGGSVVLPGTLAFVSDRDGNREIYSIDGDGTGLRRLTTHAGRDEAPAWSPGGGEIAFASDRDGTRGIHVMRADGSQATRVIGGLAPDDGVYELAWSPDGSTIAFGTLREGQFQVGTVRAGDGTVAYLTADPGFNAQPAWSPDGTKVAFVSDRVAYDFGYNIYTMNADGTDVRLLTEGLVFWPDVYHNLHPAWSPDGSMIAYVHATSASEAGMRFAVAVMSAAGDFIRDLAWAGDVPNSELLDPGSLAWAPDGSGIVYTFRDCDLTRSTICTNRRSVRYVSLDGGQTGTIVENADSPAWRP